MPPGTDAVDASLLRERLRDTILADDPSDVVMPPNSERWPAEFRQSVMMSLKPAGVRVPVFERHDGLSLLLTERSAELKHHAGQISFPGGRMEEHDATVETTALRETHEEVGIAPQHVTVAGYLRPMPPVTGYAVTPIVGFVAPDVELQLDRTEVERAFEVPLAFLMERRNARAFEREYRGRIIPTIEFHYEGLRIWGATAHIIVELRKIILNQ